MTETGGLRESQRSNLHIVLLTVGVVLGGLAGFFLPYEIWRSGGTTTLGDFGMVGVCGVALWMGWQSGGSRARIGSAVAFAAVLMIGREFAWRYDPTTLSVLYGCCTGVLVFSLLGLPVYNQFSGGRGPGRVSIESVVSVLIGLLVLGWLSLSTVKTLVLG